MNLLYTPASRHLCSGKGGGGSGQSEWRRLAACGQGGLLLNEALPDLAVSHPPPKMAARPEEPRAEGQGAGVGAPAGNVGARGGVVGQAPPREPAAVRLAGDTERRRQSAAGEDRRERAAVSTARDC